jgi:ribose 5-phosphate isomerase B
MLGGESMIKRIALGTDHGGFILKSELLPWLQEQGVEVRDVGAYSMDPADDYPDSALGVAQAVASGEVERGIILCGSGVGACVVANKVAGVRASTCHDTYSAHQGVEHDDMNVLCLGARVIGSELAKELIAAFLNARFTGEERHRRRLDKVIAIEQKSLSENTKRPSGGTP